MGPRSRHRKVSPAAADVVAHVLGGTEVWVHGTPIERWASQRSLAILRYLLVDPTRAVHKDELMALLWPHSSKRSARNNLNVAIYGLRRSLDAGGEGTYVVHRAGTYAFSPQISVVSDLGRFDTAVRRGHAAWHIGDTADAQDAYEQALAQHGGPVFADDHEFDWHSEQRRSVADQVATARERLAEFAFADGNHTRAIELGRQLVTDDPCRETAHQILMRVYFETRQFQLVARQYADCIDALDTAGRHPAPETAGLFARLTRR